jgi:hypothetical protein
MALFTVIVMCPLERGPPPVTQHFWAADTKCSAQHNGGNVKLSAPIEGCVNAWIQHTALRPRSTLPTQGYYRIPSESAPTKR